jgi:hypothetical protein
VDAMKINVRRKVANGLVIGLQLGVVAPMVAGSAIAGIKASSSLDSFVAGQPPSSLQEMDAALILAATDSKPAEADPVGDDPTGSDPSASDATFKDADPSAGDGPVDFPTAEDQNILNRESFTEPPDGE